MSSIDPRAGEMKAALASVPPGVPYPSIEKFVEMVMSPEYKKIAVHRTAALENARLIATVKKG